MSDESNDEAEWEAAWDHYSNDPAHQLDLSDNRRYVPTRDGFEAGWDAAWLRQAEHSLLGDKLRAAEASRDDWHLVADARSAELVRVMDRIAVLERVAEAAREVDDSGDPVEYTRALSKLHDTLQALHRAKPEAKDE